MEPIDTRNQKSEIRNHNLSSVLAVRHPVDCALSFVLWRRHRWLAVWLVTGLTVAFFAVQTRAEDNLIQSIIQQAGNADSDELRLDCENDDGRSPG